MKGKTTHSYISIRDQQYLAKMKQDFQALILTPKNKLKEFFPADISDRDFKGNYVEILSMSSSRRQEQIVKIYSSSASRAEKIDEIIDVCCFDQVAQAEDMMSLIKLFSKKPGVASFFDNPQKFLDEDTVFSEAEKYLIQRLYTSVYPSQAPIQYNGPLESVMNDLNLPSYHSLDAGNPNFIWCIPGDVENKKNLIRAANSQALKYRQTMGLAGVQSNYSREGIRRIAQEIRKTHLGACHQMAFLGVDLLLTKMENEELPPMSIKVVSHMAGLASHTYILLGHEGDDLTDLSTCVIADPWAVAMGHHDHPHGLFTQTSYPYGMLSDLNVVYAYSPPEQVQEKKAVTTSSQSPKFTENQGTNRSKFLNSVKLTSKKPRKAEIVTLSSKDVIALIDASMSNMDFITKFKPKWRALNLLKENLKENLVEPDAALLMAIDISLIKRSGIKEISEGEFVWERSSDTYGQTASGQHLLTNFINQDSDSSTKILKFLRNRYLGGGETYIDTRLGEDKTIMRGIQKDQDICLSLSAPASSNYKP